MVLKFSCLMKAVENVNAIKMLPNWLPIVKTKMLQVNKYYWSAVFFFFTFFFRWIRRCCWFVRFSSRGTTLVASDQRFDGRLEASNQCLWRREKQRRHWRSRALGGLHAIAISRSSFSSAVRVHHSIPLSNVDLSSLSRLDHYGSRALSSAVLFMLPSLSFFFADFLVTWIEVLRTGSSSRTYLPIMEDLVIIVLHVIPCW